MIKKALFVIFGVVLIEILIWFVLYPVFSYNDTTLLLAELVIFILGIVLIAYLKFNLNKIGLGIKKFLLSLLILLIVHLIMYLITLIFNNLDPIFRKSYLVKGFIHNWLLIAIGEELIFTAILFNLLKLSKMKPWKTILLISLAFALFHIPGYISMIIYGNSNIMDLVLGVAINISSWLFLGTIYAISNNFYLTAFTHASTDYPILPVITKNPLFGFIFIILIIITSLMLKLFVNKKQTLN